MGNSMLTDEALLRMQLESKERHKLKENPIKEKVIKPKREKRPPVDRRKPKEIPAWLIEKQIRITEIVKKLHL